MLSNVLDDIAYSSNYTGLNKKLKSSLFITLSVKIFGQLRSCVGCTTIVSGTTIKMDHSSYGRACLEEARMEGANGMYILLP